MITIPPKTGKPVFHPVSREALRDFLLDPTRIKNILKDFFADITNPILDNNADIYQYVGDEVIVAWKLEDGIPVRKMFLRYEI